MGSSSASAVRNGVIAASFFLIGAAGLASATTCSEDRLDLRGPGGRAHLTIEVADSAAERSRGLMFRKDLAADAGMLFVYPAPQRVGFWMKNTLIPLDMIFADAAGRVLHVHESAVPLDETVINGGPGVQFVLEVAAGRAAAMGIAAGTEMRHPSITQPAWPCE